MAQYIDGTVTVTQNATTVTGAGTAWSTDPTSANYIPVGALFIRQGVDVCYEVASVDSNAQTLELTGPYRGEDAAGVAYVIARDFSPINGIPILGRNDLEAHTIFKRAVMQLDGGASNTTAGASFDKEHNTDGTHKAITVEHLNVYEKHQVYTQSEADAAFEPKLTHNYNAASDPTVNDDTSAGYSENSYWYNGTTDTLFRCIDSTAGAAQWVNTGLSLENLGSMAFADIDATAAREGDALVYDATLNIWVPRKLAAPINHIGTPGLQGFGVGIYPDTLPSGFSELGGTSDPASDNYGNYQYSDGSVMVWVPAFYYKIGTGSNGLTVNVVDIKSEYAYTDETAANADGYALHRAFKDGGATKRGFFVDKYQASNNGGVASSLQNGNPLSSNSAHNPFSGLTGAPADAYYGAIDAAKTRAADFAPASRFIYAALALLSLAHGQAATGATHCAWYDATGATNFPKGNNNNALGDVNDGTIVYTSDGYGNCGQTGSGAPFAKTTHNGQACGIADLNGNMWEISLGVTRPGTSGTDTTQQDDAAAFYVLKESVALKNLTSGFGAGNDAWGDATHLATLYDAITLAHITNAGTWERFGSGSNQVLDEATSGDGYRMTGAGIYTADGHAASGTNLFGLDGIYEYHRANLCVLSGGNWGYGSDAGVWAAALNGSRSYSSPGVGFRAACYFV